MKKALISILKLSSIALLTLLIFSCEKEIESKVDLGEIINDAGSFEEPADNYSESEPEEFEENSGNDLYFCTRKTVSLTQGTATIRSLIRIHKSFSLVTCFRAIR